jgi:uncharacterized protein
MNPFRKLYQSISRNMFAVAGFLIWSAVMIGLGNKAPDFGVLQVQAATPDLVVRLDRDRLSGINLGKFEAYEPENGDLVARGHDYFYSPDENFGIGVWESKPGSMKYKDLEYDELMYVLEGTIVLTDDQGVTSSYGAGEGLVLPAGWTGTFTVPEGGVRKIWVSYMAGKKG